MTKDNAGSQEMDGAKSHYLHYLQAKHHRWKLDRRQIEQYSLGDALDPSKDWWEDFNIEGRELGFFTFRTGSCFVTLICEDLARTEPCQSVIRSVGANLVIALLMDGPQIPERWSGRYATVLADDPGSSVLTVTSKGLLERSAFQVKNPSRSVALWKDDSGNMREFDLDRGDHALLLTLTRETREEFTLDGRSDNATAHAWRLSGTRRLRASAAHNPITNEME